jgi:hypothetical protein
MYIDHLLSSMRTAVRRQSSFKAETSICITSFDNTSLGNDIDHSIFDVHHTILRRFALKSETRLFYTSIDRASF